MDLDGCLYLNALSCQHGEHAGRTHGGTAMPTCQMLVSTYADVRGQPLCPSLEKCNRKGREKEGERANRSLPVPNPPPTPGKSQAIQHLQVKLLGIATVTKLGDLHPKPVPPKSCRSCGAVREGKEKHLKTSSGTGS